jgi:hypothetical protein
MLVALCDHLQEKPDLYLDEMAVFLWDEIGTQATTSRIRRALISKNRSKTANLFSAITLNIDCASF